MYGIIERRRPSLFEEGVADNLRCPSYDNEHRFVGAAPKRAAVLDSGALGSSPKLSPS